MKENIYTICCESLSVFKSKEDAKKFYKICSLSSDGKEKERYMNVLINLDSNEIATDNSTRFCDKITIQTNDDNKFIVYNTESSSIKETINKYETILKPILEISNKYNINFNSKIPFEDFGDDDSSFFMYSFSSYYQELLKKFNIDIEKIYTYEVSDGKYNMQVNDNITIGIKAWDNFKDVVNNTVAIMIKLYDKDLEL